MVWGWGRGGGGGVEAIVREICNGREGIVMGLKGCRDEGWGIILL
jgi:hypothetical protein